MKTKFSEPKEGVLAEVKELTHRQEILENRQDNRESFWRKFAVLITLSIGALVVYWISVTNERWEESNEVSKLEAELNLVHEKTISRKDERVDELVEKSNTCRKHSLMPTPTDTRFFMETNAF